MSEPKYQISPEDTEGMLRYLRLMFPKFATPEIAVIVLDRLHMKYEKLEEFEPDAIEEILKDLEEH